MAKAKGKGKYWWQDKKGKWHYSPKGKDKNTSSVDATTAVTAPATAAATPKGYFGPAGGREGVDYGPTLDRDPSGAYSTLSPWDVPEGSTAPETYEYYAKYGIKNKEDLERALAGEDMTPTASESSTSTDLAVTQTSDLVKPSIEAKSNKDKWWNQATGGKAKRGLYNRTHRKGQLMKSKQGLWKPSDKQLQNASGGKQLGTSQGSFTPAASASASDVKKQYGGLKSQVKKSGVSQAASVSGLKQISRPVVSSSVNQMKVANKANRPKINQLTYDNAKARITSKKKKRR